MGAMIDPHEIYFGTIFERFNRRFGPSFPAGDGSKWAAGGIDEVAELQREFEIFKPGRPFVKSAALLGITGSDYGPSKNRWISYLEKLPTMKSDQAGVTGDERIVQALLDNFARRGGPLPCHMLAHDGRKVAPGLVVVSTEKPLFYLESVNFLTLRLPMRPSKGPGAATGFGTPVKPAPKPKPTPKPKSKV